MTAINRAWSQHMSNGFSEGVVIVGRKPVMNYVVACLSVFNTGAVQVRVKARGQAISRAVETATLLRKAFIKDLVFQDISISTQEFIRLDKRGTRVSTIDIVLSKSKT